MKNDGGITDNSDEITGNRQGLNAEDAEEERRVRREEKKAA